MKNTHFRSENNKESIKLRNEKQLIHCHVTLGSFYILLRAISWFSPFLALFYNSLVYFCTSVMLSKDQKIMTGIGQSKYRSRDFLRYLVRSFSSLSDNHAIAIFLFGQISMFFGPMLRTNDHTRFSGLFSLASLRVAS